jgi:hypothetical protein
MKRFLTLLPALALAVVLTGLLACSGGDDDGGLPMYTPVPVTAEINGVVKFNRTNVKSGSVAVPYYPIGAGVAAYALDDPAGEPLDDYVIQDGSYSLSVTGYAGTPVYLYLNDDGILTRLGAVAIQAGNVRQDFAEDQRVVTIKGTTAGYSDASLPTPSYSGSLTYTVRIVDEAYSPARVIGRSIVTGGEVYTIDIPVPAANATYPVLLSYADYGSFSGSAPTKVGTVAVSSTVSSDITHNIAYTRKLTAINGSITGASYSGPIVAGSAPSLSEDTILGLGQGTGNSYNLTITQPTAALTVYLFEVDSYMLTLWLSGNASAEDISSVPQLTSLTVNANAATASKNFAYTVTGYSTSLSGKFVYKENGTAQDLGSGGFGGMPGTGVGSLSVVDEEDNDIGSGWIVYSSPGVYTYTATVRRASNSIKAYLVHNGYVKAKSDPVTITGSGSQSADITINASVSTIKGAIAGSGKSAISGSTGGLRVYNKDRDADDAEEIGSADISSGSPYTYTGRIIRLEAPVRAYYYVWDSLGNYYKIGEKDLEASKPEYINDFIIGLVNKRIVPAL